MVEHLKFTPSTLKDWVNSLREIVKERPWAADRVANSFTESQLVGKMWIAEELKKIGGTKHVALLGGWFAHLTCSLLFEEVGVSTVTNFEIDHDAHFISFKFNRRYKEEKKYRSIRRNVMIDGLSGVETFEKVKTTEPQWDVVINTSCEHMFPMRKFRELNPQLKDCLYVLHSTDDDQYEDHINCVSSAQELADQANITDIKFMGEKVLPNGMKRFMVIGR